MIAVLFVSLPVITWKGLALFFVYGAVMVCAVVQTPSVEDLCKATAIAVNDALSAAHIDVKVAADAMGLQPARLYQQLRGEPENPIALWRLLRLPLTFWCFLLPWLAYRVSRISMLQRAATERELR